MCCSVNISCQRSTQSCIRRLRLDGSTTQNEVHWTAGSIMLHNYTLNDPTRVHEQAASMLQGKYRKSQQEGTAEMRAPPRAHHTDSDNVHSRLLQMVGVLALSCA